MMVRSTVEISGATYTVIWQVDGEEYIGAAIGAANLKGSIIFGEAVANDTALAVSYGSGGNFGLALFVEQENGQWHGFGLMAVLTRSDLKRGHANSINLCMLIKITSGFGTYAHFVFKSDPQALPILNNVPIFVV
jgi:hypothetical protein